MDSKTPTMEPPSILTKVPYPFAGHVEDSTQVKNASTKIPQDIGTRENKMEASKSPGRKISELLKEREREWSDVVRKAGPLRLIDLPLELLTEILREVTHTNDLANLALTCSALHSVVTPLIYSRFDIVWPDASNSSESRSGVDALTYGLATLVMREDLFENSMLPRDDPMQSVCHNYSCSRCGMVNHIPKASQSLSKRPRRLRRGNYFSQFTKKFSLGNGPPDWVQEYLITRESGKMLGTLVALSIARMPNLESFVWDMPTGILRDIWTALSSLGDYDSPRLSKVWVRFHDNKSASHDAGLVYPAPPKHDNVLLPHSSIPLVSMPSYSKLVFSGHPTEHPNFSHLPPMQSLTVLAIDELSYLEEISILIGRSREKLRELRIGLASKINTSGHDDQHPTVQLFAAGTEMALLLNAIHNTFDPRSDDYIYKPKPLSLEGGPTVTEEIVEVGDSGAGVVQNEDSRNLPEHAKIVSDSTFGLSKSMSRMSFSSEIPLGYAIDPALPQTQPPRDVPLPPSPPPTGSGYVPLKATSSPQEDQKSNLNSTIPQRKDTKAQQSKLVLEALELEGCLLNVFVLTQSIDFSILTSLTLLHCEAADILWAQLSRQYPSPSLKPKSLTVSIPTPSTTTTTPRGEPTKTLRRKSTMDLLFPEPAYQLNLRRIHTDTVSSSLITFLSKTLAPNSLEWLFLQDNPTFMSPVTIDAMYKGPLRRHRASLTKVMIDSSTGASGSRSRSSSALKWMLSHEILTFVTSGKMSKLRELAMVVEYKDWHFFLQQLPSIPRLRSLYVPHIANHVYGSGLNVKELALGVVDVVTLRPEVELCYLGIATKCFEILEKKHASKRKHAASSATSSEDTDDEGSDEDQQAEEAHGGNDDVEANDDDDDDDDEDEDGVSAPTAVSDNVDDVNDDMSSSEDEVQPPATEKLRYKLREILFYDDKVSIFKARHGRL